MDLITVPEDQEYSPLITVEPSIPIEQLTPEEVEIRTGQYKYAVSDTSADRDASEIAKSLQEGREGQLRRETAANLNLDNNRLFTQQLTKRIAAKEGPLGPEDADWLRSVKPKEYDPETVFEEQYGNQYINELNKFAQKQDEDHFWNKATKDFPTDTAAAEQWGSITMAQHMYFLKLYSEVAKEIEQKPWFGQLEKDKPSYEASENLSNFFGQKLGDYLKVAFPFFNPYTEYNLRGNVKGSSFWHGLLGDSLEDQRTKLRSLPFPEFARETKRIVGELRDKNPLLASMFLQSMIGQSSSDYLLNQVNTLSLSVDALGAGIASVKVAKALRAAPEVMEMQEAVKDVIKTAGDKPKTKADVLATVGDTSSSAKEAATPKIVNAATGKEDPNEVLNTLFRFFKKDAESIEKNPGPLNNTEMNILLEETKDFTENLKSVFRRGLRPNRLPLELATKDELERIAQTVPDRYNIPDNALLDISDPVKVDGRGPKGGPSLTNHWEVTMSLGKPGGGLFSSYTEAQNFAKSNLGFQDAKIKRQGLGFYAQVTRPVTENSSITRDFLYPVPKDKTVIPRATSQTPEHSPIFAPFEWVMTAENTLSKEHRANRKAALYPQSLLRGLAQQEAEKISDLLNGVQLLDEKGRRLRNPNNIPLINPLITKFLNIDKYRAFERALRAAQEATDPATKRKGYFFENPEELSNWYLTNIHRQPTFMEVRAYFANKNLIEMDRILREIELYKNQIRLGNEVHTVKFRNKLMGHNGGPPLDNEVSFVGVRRNKIPGGTDDMLILGNDSRNSRSVSLERMPLKDKKLYNELIKTGKLKIVELWDPESTPFAGKTPDGQHRVRYVLTPTVESKALTWDQVPRLGGGHFQWNFPHYIKQARIRTQKTTGPVRNIYEGDVTVAGVNFKAQGEEYVKQLNEVREAILVGDEVTAKTLYNKYKEPLSVPYKKFRAKFNKSKDKETGLIVGPALRKDIPFTVTDRNRLTVDMNDDLIRLFGGHYKDGGTYKDGTREGSMARNFQVEFTGRRDADELLTVTRKEGTKEQPLFGLTRADMLDPVTVMNRSIGRIINSSSMNDYKVTAVESWLQEALPHLGPKHKPERVLASPYSSFNEIGWQSFRKGTPLVVKNRLMANKFKINQLIRTPGWWDNFVEGVSQKLLDAAYEDSTRSLKDRLKNTVAHPLKTAEAGLGHLHTLTPDAFLYTLKDPFAFMRKVTFHAKMGLFATPQLIAQSMTYAMIWAHSPKAAAWATYANFLDSWTTFNQQLPILKHMDKLVSRMKTAEFSGGRPGEFLEVRELYDKSGFGNVGPEWGPLDNYKQVNLIRGQGSKALDAGTSPFILAERGVRKGAYFTAYREFRVKHPTKAITHQDEIDILDRADDLYQNMSSASHSAINSGIFSLPAQFSNYAMRMTELTWSKRIGETLADRTKTRARIFAINAALFGIPIGAAGTIGLPIADWLREKAMEYGYDVNKNKETGLDWAEYMAQEGLVAPLLHMITGKNYNFNERFGNKGVTLISDLFSDEAKVWDFLGASGDVFGQTFGPNKDGFVDAMAHVMSGGSLNPEYKPTVDDFMDVFKEFSTINRFWGMYIGAQTGIHINKNYDFVYKTSPPNELFMFLTGLNASEQTDNYHRGNVTAAWRDREAYARKRITQEINKAMLARDADSSEAPYIRKAYAIGKANNLERSDIAEAIRRAFANGGRSLVDRSNWQMRFKSTPQDLRDIQLKTLRSIEKGKQ